MKLSRRVRIKIRRRRSRSLPSYPIYKCREKKLKYFKNKYLHYLYNALCDLYLPFY